MRTNGWFEGMVMIKVGEREHQARIRSLLVQLRRRVRDFHALSLSQGLAGNVRRYQAFAPEYMQHLLLHSSKFITIAALVNSGGAIGLASTTCSSAASRVSLLRTIHGKPLRWNGARRPRRRLGEITSARTRVVYHDPYQYGVESWTRRLRHANLA